MFTVVKVGVLVVGFAVVGYAALIMVVERQEASNLNFLTEVTVQQDALERGYLVVWQG